MYHSALSFQNSYRRGYAPLIFLAILAGICGGLWPGVCAAAAILPSPFPSCLSGHGFAQSGFISPEKSAKKSGLHNRPFMETPCVLYFGINYPSNSYPRGSGDCRPPMVYCTAGTNKKTAQDFIYPHRHKVQQHKPKSPDSLLIKRIISSKIGIGA